MVSRVGIGLFLIGSIATILGAFATTGNVVVPDFNGWRVAFHAGILAVFLAVATITVKPKTPGEILIATALGVIGQVGVSVALVMTSGEQAIIAHTLTWQVLPLVPMSTGYVLGGLRSVNERFDRQSYYICVLSILGGLIAWTGSYVLFVFTHDTTGEAGYHPGFLFIFFAVILLADVIGAIVLFALWRVSERPGTENTAPSGNHG